MLRMLACALLVSLSSLAPTQAAEQPNKQAHQEAMKKLAFLLGEWEGNGSMAMGPGPRQTFNQTEKIQLKHDGTLLLIEGQGKSPQSGEIVHDALAVVTFDPSTAKYKFRSFAAVGRYADTEAAVEGNKFTWWLNPGPVKIRYTIIVENGVWREIGERSSDGNTWQAFFDMTVKRKQ